MTVPGARIDGVHVKELVTHPDERGFFREVIRVTDPWFNPGFGQWSHSSMVQGVIKAWHEHRIQTDYWYVCAGLLRIGLWDRREQSPTRGRTMDFLMGEGLPGMVLKIPPGVAHGCKVLRAPAHLVYMTTHTYNPADELRIPLDAPESGFDWLNETARGF